MSVVCSICGSSNRPKAKYCVGCAHPLGAVIPSAPAELDAVMSFRPASDASAHDSGSPWSAGRAATVPALPPDTAVFWFRAGCLALAVIFGFAIWTLYVTSGRSGFPLADRISALWSPKADKPAAAALASTQQPPSEIGHEPMSAIPADPAADKPSAQSGSRPPDTTALASAPAGTAGTAGKSPAAHSAPMPSPIAEMLPAIRSASAAESARLRRERGGDATGSARSRAAARNIDQDEEIDPTPAPVRSAPLPAGRSPSYRSFDDDGPPVVAGPGPQYDYSQMPVRAPGSIQPSVTSSYPSSATGSVASSTHPSTDLGPPLAPGPGPQYDYSRFPVVRAPTVRSADSD